MNATFDAFLRSWPSEPWLVGALLLSAIIYARGWFFLYRRDPCRWHLGRLAAYLGGLAAVFLALASPIEPFAALFLQVHMVQHMLLMMVAPPLLWLGAPLFPWLRGLPELVTVYWLTPLLRSRGTRRFFRRLTHPLVAWPVFVGSTWLWHTPRGYELALSRSDWHLVEHACFAGTALLFWYPVVRPYPCRPRWSLWILLPYLILADVQSTVLSAWLTFSSQMLYPHYAQVPRFAAHSVLDDQAAAGVIMWVPGSIAFLVPLFWIGIQLFNRPESSSKSKRSVATKPVAVPVTNLGSLPVISLGEVSDARRVGHWPIAHVAARRNSQPWDALRIPLVGRFLKWRWARIALQLPMVALAGVVIYDGLRGPAVAPMNLAGVLPWIHWRGVLMFALLVSGNVFCMACPFTVPRTLARRWLSAGKAWPRWLRSKWLAVGLMALFLWSYEGFALWDSPWWTAWIVVGYFVAAAVVDGFFRGAAFCKYVCPIGQFNFVQSLVSPLEVKVRDAGICASCRTKECIRGSGTIPGCEMQLFQPRKSGNMDCTFCLDCVHACPHENVGLLAVVPGRTLWGSTFHSGIGWYGKRRDLAALVLVLVFGAFANAGGMVGPVVERLEQLRTRLGGPPLLVMTSLYYFVALFLAPLLTVGIAAEVSRRWAALPGSPLQVATRYAYALVPLGFGMWLSHYSFHLLTSYGTIIPASQRLASDLGWTMLGEPLWQRACCMAVAEWIPHFEIVALDVGMLLSLYVGYRIALADNLRMPQALRAFAPWGILIVLLFAVGVWIVLEPMEMRGTLPMSG